MPKRTLDVDRLECLQEAVSFIIGGKEHKVKSYDPTLIDQVAAIATEFDSAGLEVIHAKQLALLTGDPEADFMEIHDARKTTAAVAFVMSAIEEAAEAATLRKKQRR